MLYRALGWASEAFSCLWNTVRQLESVWPFSCLAHPTLRSKYGCGLCWNVRCYITQFSVASILYSRPDVRFIDCFALFFHLLLRQKVFNMIASINLSPIVIKLCNRVTFSYLVRFAWRYLRERSWTVLFSWQTLLRDTVKLQVTDSLWKRRERVVFIYFGQFIVFLFLCIVSIRDKPPKDEKGDINPKNPVLI